MTLIVIDTFIENIHEGIKETGIDLFSYTNLS